MSKMQYGQGLVDWGHLEVTPLSRAAVGVYIPSPFSDHTLLLAYRRGSGPEVDIR
ncbi:hypothetical protein NDI85_21295 [Halomicroarcula sp. S1AR25-4]|uniref:hypothetical protein n=1 Tax=Haloarcula sp. S1AR25-4 TaxID=2950538 RepID=UPI002876500B|nr:hypothetical protein [Halomicroarcula sp. S1AR25-4]MDS0280324.1 hypothetical protein [Halomicroarcula sp. S1AR25-4]